MKSSKKKKPVPKPTSSNSSSGERLQKVLAAAGLGSRRDCEELILQGRVEIDRKVANELGVRVNTETQEVRVDGSPLKQTKRRYVMVNKPDGVLSTARDQWGRARVIDLIDSKDRLFTVGRLDLASTGLILLTNDGDLANLLAHPRYGVQKTYQVVVAGNPTPETIQKLRQGVYLAEGLTKVESVHVMRQLKQSAQLEIILSEGRNREIRRVLAKVGHKVMRLKRTALGPLRLGDLPIGAHRELKKTEVQALRDTAAGLVPQGKRHSGTKGSGRAATGTGSASSGNAEGQSSSPQAPRPGVTVGSKPTRSRIRAASKLGNSKPHVGSSNRGEPGQGKPTGASFAARKSSAGNKPAGRKSTDGSRPEVAARGFASKGGGKSRPAVRKAELKRDFGVPAAGRILGEENFDEPAIAPSDAEQSERRPRRTGRNPRGGSSKSPANSPAKSGYATSDRNASVRPVGPGTGRSKPGKPGRKFAGKKGGPSKGHSAKAGGAKPFERSRGKSKKKRS